MSAVFDDCLVNLFHDDAAPRSMGTLIRRLSTDTGVHGSIRSSHFDITADVVERPDVFRTKERLATAAESIGITLSTMQVDAVYNIVHRPVTTANVAHVASGISSLLRTPPTDIGCPCFMDLPTGMGKTLVTCIAALLMALERGPEIAALAGEQWHARAAPSYPTGVVPVKEPVRYVPASVVFVPRHLHAQWCLEAERAVRIVGIMYPDSGVSWTPKHRLLASQAVLNPQLFVCDSSRATPKSVIDNGIVYPCIAFDESSESTSCASNAAYVQVFDVPFCARTLFISADFTTMIRRHSKLMRSTGLSWIRRVLKVSDSNVLSLAFFDGGYVGVSPSPKAVREVREACDVLGVMTIGALFSSERRAAVVEEAQTILNDAKMLLVRMPYRPSLVETTTGSSDLGSRVAARYFESVFGVHIEDCKTLAAVIKRVDAKRASKATSHALRVKLLALRERLLSYTKEPCPICLETDVKCLVLLQPCTHALCSKCRERVRECPLCRSGIVATFAAGSSSKSSKSSKSSVDIDVGWSFANRFVHHARAMTPDILCGAQQAACVTIDALRAAKGSETLRVMVVASQDDLDVIRSHAVGFTVFEHRIAGTRENVVRRTAIEKTLRDFSKDDGTSKILVVKDSYDAYGVDVRNQCRDSMTGLDLPAIECLVSAGSQNRTQRVGRLLRLSRMFQPAERRNAIYVELSAL